MTTKQALSLGIGVAPNTIYLDSETRTSSFEIVNPNDFEISYNIKASNIFELDSFGTIPAQGSKKVKIELLNPVDRTELIIIEAKAVEGIGVMPGVAVKAIVQPGDASKTAAKQTPDPDASKKPDNGLVFLQEENKASQENDHEKSTTEKIMIPRLWMLLSGVAIAGAVVLGVEIFTKNKKKNKRLKKNGNKKFK